MDDSIMRHVSSKAEVGEGKWYFDYANDKVYIADSPSGKVMEIGTARRAFGDSSISGVVIKNLIV